MIIVAPQGQWSGCGHQVTADTPIHVDRRSEFEYAVGGTPEGEYFHYAGEYSKRDRAAGTDVDVCFGGNIAVTQIFL
jgi:broad specificity polyphosphatase/5'/3'-nucleotidase SurE